jgi:hypothetical protein
MAQTRKRKNRKKSVVFQFVPENKTKEQPARTIKHTVNGRQ